MSAYRIGFVLEQTLGHVTHSRNLRAIVPADADVRAYWRLIRFETGGLGQRIPLYRGNWTLRAGLRTRAALAELQRVTPLDALLFHTQVPAMLATDWLRRVPSVVSLDATPRQYDTLGAAYQHRTGPHWLEQAKWHAARECFQAARHLVTWSEWAKAGLTAEYTIPAAKISVIAPGVDTAAWAAPARPAHNRPVKILFVGADLARKGGLLLLEAFSTLRASMAVELHLVTKTPVAPAPGLFVYTDLEPNSVALRRLYQQSDIFCLPTLGDCLPMVLAEAGAAGLPLVSTAVAAIPELVRDGVTGRLVPPGDLAALTAALASLVEDSTLRLRLGAAAAALVASQHDAARNTRRLLDLLKLVADRVPAA